MQSFWDYIPTPTKIWKSADAWAVWEGVGIRGSNLSLRVTTTLGEARALAGKSPDNSLLHFGKISGYYALQITFLLSSGRFKIQIVHFLAAST
jgi:hypothetical protein